MFFTKFQKAILSQKIFFNFLLILLTLALIFVGGLTRLTGSGLSMVDWEPIRGIVPPFSESSWQEEFNNYKQFPEYKLKNRFMSLAEFKKIFYFEYFHRVLARLLGLLLLAISIYFFWRRQLQPREVVHYIFLILLVGGQGLLGWYMVKSGLVDDPNVSHYRLLAHLMTALFFLIYLWVFTLSLLPFKRKKKSPLKKWPLNLLLLLLILQICLGALNSGLDAGLISNEYPKMFNRWIPEQVFGSLTAIQGDFFSSLLSLFDNPIFIHFFHRHLGVILSVLCLVFAIFFLSKAELPDIKIAALLFIFLSLCQPLIGIFITILSVPVLQASLHQMVAVFMLLNLFYLRYRLV